MNLKTVNCSMQMLGRFAITACGIALCVPLLEWSFEPHLKFAYLVSEYFFSLAYAFCIGGLLSAALPVLWKKSAKWPLLSRWMARVLTVVGANGLGCLLAGVFALWIFCDECV